MLNLRLITSYQFDGLKIPLLVFHIHEWSHLWITMNALSDFPMNVMSISDPESIALSKLLFGWFFTAFLAEWTLAVLIPLPFNTCWHEVEWICFWINYMIGTVVITFVCFHFSWIIKVSIFGQVNIFAVVVGLHGVLSEVAGIRGGVFATHLFFVLQLCLLRLMNWFTPASMFGHWC